MAIGSISTRSSPYDAAHEHDGVLLPGLAACPEPATRPPQRRADGSGVEQGVHAGGERVRGRGARRAGPRRARPGRATRRSCARRPGPPASGTGRRRGGRAARRRRRVVERRGRRRSSSRGPRLVHPVRGPRTRPDLDVGGCGCAVQGRVGRGLTEGRDDGQHPGPPATSGDVDVLVGGRSAAHLDAGLGEVERDDDRRRQLLGARQARVLPGAGRQLLGDRAQRRQPLLRGR